VSDRSTCRVVARPPRSSEWSQRGGSMEFHEMLRKMVVEKASDLFIKVGSPPSLRVDGEIMFLDTEEVTTQDAMEMFEIIEDSRKEGFDARYEIDTAYEVPGIGRFRVNIFRQRGQLGFVLRHIAGKASKVGRASGR